MSLININSLIVSECNVRQKRDPEKEEEYISNLASSISTFGLCHPPTVVMAENGCYKIVAGQRRVEACRRLGWSEIPCKVLTDDDNLMSICISFNENFHRSNMFKSDLCKAVSKVVDQLNGDFKKAKTYLNMSIPTIKRYVKIATLSDEELSKLDEVGDERLTLQDAATLVDQPQHDESLVGDGNSGTPNDDEDPPEKKPKKKSVKTEPWIYDTEGIAVPIPENLHNHVYQLVSNHN